MLNRYKVSAQVDSAKFGKGELVAYLDHEDFVKYANLSDQEKLAFLKEKGAQLHVGLDEISDADVTNYKVNGQDQSMVTHQNHQPLTNTQTDSHSIRKMRMNINGNDTGWVDITEENEAQYNEMMDQFNEMHRNFNKRFNRIFGDSFFKPFGFLEEEKSNDEA